MHTTTTVSSTPALNRSPDVFDSWVAAINNHIETIPKDKPLFYVTPREPLFDTYLASFSDPVVRQVHNCRCCKLFMERFGSLATIEDGQIVPLFWSALNIPWTYGAVQTKLALAVARGTVTDVFYSSERQFGFGPKAPKLWTHFLMPNRSVYKNALLSDSQKMAERKEERSMLARSLAEFPIDVVRQTVAVLKTEQLTQSEKFLGVAQWLLDLHEQLAQDKNKTRRENVLWSAVASAPAGYAHVRSTMIGTLLEDFASGMSFADVSKRFSEKMHPLQYRRPTAAPTEGQITAAEKVIAKLRAEGSLARRFAKLEDLVALWKPAPPAPLPSVEKPAGVFDHLRERLEGLGPTDLDTPAITITWDKFRRTVLPTAEKIEYFVRDKSSYFAFVAPVNPSAPPIVQWPNQVTWYQYVYGSPYSQWNLKMGYVPVTAITLNPAHWEDENAFEHHGKAVALILEGARDTRHVRGGGLFLTHARSELNAIRHTTEEHFGSMKIEGGEEATACGLIMQKGASWDVHLRVTANGMRTKYRLDRWD